MKNLRFYSDFTKETLAYCLSRGRATVPPVQITGEKTFFVAALGAVYRLDFSELNKVKLNKPLLRGESAIYQAFMSSSEKAIEMFVGGLVLDPNTQAPVIVLKDESGDLALPIWIGVAEATSIASAIKQVAMARPLTHDLMHNIFGEIGVKVRRVIITDLKDSTYFAELIVSYGDRALIFDTRPSDAIAIALRAAAPIFVAQKVLDQAKVMFPAPAEGGEKRNGGDEADADKSQSDNEANIPPRGESVAFDPNDKEKWSDILEDLDPEDFKYKM